LDKRLLIVLPVCLAVFIGWSLLAQKFGFTPPPPKQKPAATSVVDPSTGAPKTPSSDGSASAKTGASTPAKPEVPSISPVVADTEVRTETLIVGRRGAPGYYRAVFSNQGGVLEELRSGNYFDRANLKPEEQADWQHWETLVSVPATGADPTRAFTLKGALSSLDYLRNPLERELWTMAKLGTDAAPEGVEFRLSPGTGLTFVKRFRFVPGSDQIRFELSITNEKRTDIAGLKSFVLTPAAGVPNDSGDTFYSEPQAIVFSRARDGSDAKPVVVLVHDDGSVAGDTIPTGSPLTFAGVYNKYFAVLLRAEDDAAKSTLVGASWRGLHDAHWAAAHPDKATHAWRQLEADIDLQLALPAVGETRTWNYITYAGPKQKDALEAVCADHAVMVEHDLGLVSGISKILLFVLNGFHALTSSWGLAIILLTIGVRALLFPINRRSQTAMARYQSKMKRVQPKIDAIKKKYADDPATLRREQGKIMQEEGLFPPLGGCLPPLLQIPVFIGLFRAIGVSFDLRQAPFVGFIHDLSLPDRLVQIDWTLPLVGHVPYLNILPPVMVVMWILQQRSMPMPTDDQAKTMYKMMMWMPVVMGIFLYNYAAGLSLYMITQSCLGILEQKVIRKYWPVDDTEPVKKPGQGFMARILAAQEAKAKQLESQRSAAQRSAKGRR
jgi:YidC/Oxa1 family membrane protein insertase